MVTGGSNVAGNMMFLAVIEQFSEFYWSDNDGVAHKFQFDQIGIYHLTMLKILICALFVR
jgi:hypothetical protein